MSECLFRRRYNNDDVKIVSWQDGTDEEIAAMIAAADAGQINLTDHWSLGDKRTTHLSAITAGNALINATDAQDIVLVLMDTGANSGYKDINGKAVNYVVGQESCLSVEGRMNSTITNKGSWDSCAMRTDLNDKYYNALPITFRACLKQFQTITATERNATTVTISNDYISLFAEKEIIGTANRGNETEASILAQIKYYESAPNRIKKLNDEVHYYWLRSPSTSSGSSFCIINTAGNTVNMSATGEAGVAPFMCI